MTHKKRILLIEDEEEIAALIKLNAEAAGYRVHVEVDGINGYKAIERDKPDLVILDVMLPGQNGFDICKKAKHHPELRSIPILILSAKREDMDEILGLELGADDYVAKPFSPKVLLSRIKTILKRPREVTKTYKAMQFGEFTMEAERYLLRKADQPVTLTLSEFGILRRLLTNPGKVLTREELLKDVDNNDALIVDRNIDVHIASLRKKLGPNFNWIETVRGIGYRFRQQGSLI